MKLASLRSLLLPLISLAFLSSMIFAQEKLTLRVANWASAEEVKMEEHIAEEFMRRHPDVNVVIESIPANYKQKILTSIAAGSVADVFLLDSPIIPALLNKDVLVDLKPYVEEENLNLDTFFPNVLKIFEKGGSLYAIPKDFTPIMMYYNKDMFDKANLPYPSTDWTWEDYLRKAQKLTRDTDEDGAMDQYGTVFQNYFYLWQPWIWMAKGDIVDPTGTSAVGYFNSPETERAMQFLINLRTQYEVTPQSGGTGSSETGGSGIIRGLFFSDKLGMMPNGHWWLLTLRDYMRKGDVRVGVAPLPRPKEGQKANVIYASGWCVPKTTPHRDLAVKLAFYLSGEKASRIRSEMAIGIPAIEEIANEQVASDTLGVEKVFVDEVPYGRQSWGTVIDDFTRIEKMTQSAVDEVMIGGRDIHEVFTETAERIDEELKRTAQFSDQVVELKGNWEILRFLLAVIILVALAIFIYYRWQPPEERPSLLSSFKFLTPSFIILLIFIFTPVIFSLYLSFHHWNVVSSNKPFVGLNNFIALFQDTLFWNSFKNTLIYTLHVPVGMVLSLGVAVLMNRDIRGIAFLRTIFFLPSISSFVAVALVWQWMYHPQFGLINYVLSLFGIGRVGWLTDPDLALISVMVLSIWIGIGYQMVIFLAGLQSIPNEMYESALTDGANAWQRFWYITLPLLRPTTFFVLVTSIINSFQVFTLIYVMTEGGPLHSTDVVVFRIFESAWDYLKMGYASAMSWILFIVIVIITWLQFKVFGREVHYR